MMLVRSKHYKTNPKNPTGLATCDFCGMACNGGNLRKYITYAGSPMANYSVPQKFMQSGDVMGNSQPQWNGMMVCPRCVDKPNPQSAYKAPLGDPFIADGNRPMKQIALDASQIAGELLLEDGDDILLETGGTIGLES